ncbi:hypothetical protein BKI52_45150 [marine bacterium AO1-C]|nr:hypothetical protein BKI52_45150 [marine bacterium AO1-C]
MNNTIQSKEEVMRSFENLLAERKALMAKITTKEETAKKEENKELVSIASNYTPNSIVTGLAELQLSLGNSVEELALQLQGELSKLEELKSAIKVEKETLKYVKDSKVAADALHILTQEQDAQGKAFEENTTLQYKRLEEEIAEQNYNWEKEQRDFDLSVKEYTETLKKERDKELADYEYELERTYKIEADEYTDTKKYLERDLNAKSKEKNKDWTQRKSVLDENQEQLQKFKQRVDNFETEVKEASNKARESAIKDASRKAKVAAELKAKEVEGSKKVHEMQIKSLEDTIAKNNEQIEKLSAELKDALSQVQGLSLTALENTVKGGKTKSND